MAMEDKWAVIMEELGKNDVEQVVKLVEMMEDEDAVSNLVRIERTFSKLQKQWKHRLEAEDVLNRLYRNVETLQFAQAHNDGVKISRSDIFRSLVQKNKWTPIEELWKKMDELEEEYKNKIPEVEIEKLEQSYKKLMEYIMKEIGMGYRDIISREFEKRIRVYRNRLERSLKVDFSTWLKSARTQRGFTLKHLGDLTGISPSYIHRIERNERKAPSIPIAEKLAISLGYDPKSILSMLGQEGAVMGLRQDDEGEVPGILELLSMSHYKLNNEVATRDEKNALGKIINQILSEQWSEEDVWTKGTELFKNIVKLQKKIHKSK